MTIARLMQMARAGVPSGGGDVWTDPDLANASYDSVSFSVAGEDTIPVSLFFSTSGEKLFVLGNSNDAIFQYSLTTAYDLSTASYDSVSFSVSSQETAVSCLAFSDDGTLMYISGSGTDSVFQYTLSTAWDLSTASYASKSFSASSQDTAIIGLSFSASGDTMYLSGGANDTLFQYSLSTPWDISTASYASKSYSASALDGNPRQHFWSPTGDKLWFLGLSTDAVYELNLSTGFDISTAAYNSVSFSVASQDATPTGVFFKSDGSKMYVVGVSTDTIYQYSTAAAAPAEWTDPDLANASYDSVSFAFGSQDATVVGFFFKPDGSKMWLVGRGNDNVYQYSLSTAWDVSTASYDSVSLSVSSQDTDPIDLHFNDDGSKMYVMGYSSDSVHQYSLSTAWDLATASYDSVSFSVASQSGLPLGLWFKPDGTKMYMTDISNDSVFQYTLSTAWDISSASYDTKSFSFSSQDSSPYKSVFSPNGDKLFMVGTSNDAIFQYSLSTDWDVTTASYDSVSFSVTGQDSSLYSVFFKSDGSKMYAIGNTTDTIYQYSTA